MGYEERARSAVPCSRALLTLTWLHFEGQHDENTEETLNISVYRICFVPIFMVRFVYVAKSVLCVHVQSCLEADL